MTTNQVALRFDEDVTVNVIPLSVHSGDSSYEADEIDFQEHGVLLRYTQSTGVAPDPVVTTECTIFVPWSNVKQIRTSRTI